MKVRLTRAARIRHKAGEIIEVSPAEAGFLLSTGSAVSYAEPMKAEAPETPEGNAASAETPETAAAKKTTRKKTTK